MGLSCHILEPGRFPHNLPKWLNTTLSKSMEYDKYFSNKYLKSPQRIHAVIPGNSFTLSKSMHDALLWEIKHLFPHWTLAYSVNSTIQGHRNDWGRAPVLLAKWNAQIYKVTDLIGEGIREAVQASSFLVTLPSSFSFLPCLALFFLFTTRFKGHVPSGLYNYATILKERPFSVNRVKAMTMFNHTWNWYMTWLTSCFFFSNSWSR